MNYKDLPQRKKRQTEKSWNLKGRKMAFPDSVVDQPEKTELEYRVIALNKSGEGQASNTVRVVL